MNVAVEEGKDGVNRRGVAWQGRRRDQNNN